MLKLQIPESEMYNEASGEFVTIKPTTIHLEHSLLSISKWESKWKKAFFGVEQKTPEQQLDYIRCMTIDSNVPPEVYMALTEDNMKQIRNYIEDPMTATTFNDKSRRRPNRSVLTSEVIYYQMVALQIPFECQKWHINRLMTLIHVCAVKNEPPKKMSKKSAANQQRSLNAIRRARYGGH